jgi:DNA-binding response OmpR family regulator
MALLQNSKALERVAMLEAGADDCMDVPYHPQELLIRLGKMIERKHSTRTGLIATKNFELNVHSGDLNCPWGKINLRKKEFLILSVLLQQKNHVVPKDRLVERIWGLEETPLISTIDVHIRRIRQKIKDYDKKIIRTAYGVGYMFCEG